MTSSSIHNWFRSKNWEAFEFQTQCWEAYNIGHSGLLMAPTGSGKTLALGIPILTGANRNSKGLQSLWITPLKALSQEIYQALSRANDELNLSLTIGLRNGDTSNRERNAQRKGLPQILVTTPESLQLLLATKGYSELFKTLKSVIIDEWHDLYASKRGALLELGLSRLKAIQPSLQLWAISATIGDPLVALSVLKGELVSQETLPQNWRIIRSNIQKQITIESLVPEKMDRFPWRGHLGLQLLDQVEQLFEQHRTVLLFTNTRSQCEIWFQALLERFPKWAGLLAMHHSSIEKTTRLWVEDALRDEKLKAVVCTSGLDLGVDFAPVEAVIQIGGPKNIARLMQRAGRSGHQPGKSSKLYFLPTHGIELIEAVALKKALLAGEIEAQLPYLNCFDVLVQYLTTLAVSDGFLPNLIFEEIRKTHCFQTISSEDWKWALDFITKGGQSLQSYDEYHRVEVDENGRYIVRNRGIAMRHRLQIGTIVSDSSIAVHFVGGGYIGTLEEWFISQLKPGDVFIFAGRTLELVRIREMKVQVRISRSKSNKVPSWMGGRLSFSSSMSRYIKEALEDLTQKEYIDSASHLFEKERQAIRGIFETQYKESSLPKRDEFLIETFQTKEGYHHLFYPFEGRFIHEALAHLLAYRLSLIGTINCSLAYTDYGFELLSDQHINIDEIFDQELWSTRHLAEDLNRAINLGELGKRSFRDIAVISGLVFSGYPDKRLKTKHLQSSSQLVYEVFKSYEPDNRLLLQAEQYVFERQLEIDRLKSVLEHINSQKIIWSKCTKPTPFSFPIITDRLRARLTNEALEDRIAKMLKQLEN